MSREKQIEEMAEILKTFPPAEVYGGTRYGRHIFLVTSLAEVLYNAGYRKQSEGEWKMKVYPITSCSVCGVLRSVEYQQGWNYCPNCGAKMKGGAE